MQNLRDDHVVGLCKILGVDLFNSHGDRDGRDGVRVVLQFLGQRLDDLEARRGIDCVTVHTVDRGDQEKTRLRVELVCRLVESHVLVRRRATGCKHG